MRDFKVKQCPKRIHVQQVKRNEFQNDRELNGIWNLLRLQGCTNYMKILMNFVYISKVCRTETVVTNFYSNL